MSTTTGLIGSLTTEFVPETTCLRNGLHVVRYRPDTAVTTDYNYYLTAGPGNPACFPSSQFPYLGSYYSPGRCPSGYSAACTATGVVETTVTCCPMMPYHFACNTDEVGGDWGVFADCTTSTSTLEVDSVIIGAVPTSKLAESSRDAAGNPILTGAVINGYGIEVRWQQTDEALLFGTMSSSISSTASDTNSATPTTSQTTSSNSHVPSPGVIAGAVVGSVAGALILLGAVIVMIRRRRRRRRKPQTTDETHHHHHHHEPANPGSGPGLSEGENAWSSQVNPPAGPDALGIIFPRHELPMPSPTAVIPRQELEVDDNGRTTAGRPENKEPEDEDPWVGTDGRYFLVGELPAVEQIGELEGSITVHLAELGDTDRRYLRDMRA